MSLFNGIDWTQVGGATTAAGVVLSGVYQLWRSIRRLFTDLQRERTAQLTALKSHMDTTFAKHEAKDQERHEENLQRFAEINVTLARNGINGVNSHAPPAIRKTAKRKAAG